METGERDKEETNIKVDLPLEIRVWVHSKKTLPFLWAILGETAYESNIGS
jgi:hypothetical protein